MYITNVIYCILAGFNIWCSLLYNGYRVFPRGKLRPGGDADPSPPSSTEVKKESRAIPLLSLRAFVACERVKPTY